MTTRRRRNPFATALAAAEAELASKQAQLLEANTTAFRLRIEIPRLEATVRSLDHQLNPRAPVHVPDAPPVRPSELGEVPEGSGSILAPVADVAPQSEAPDINSIPGMAEEGWQ